MVARAAEDGEEEERGAPLEEPTVVKGLDSTRWRRSGRKRAESGNGWRVRPRLVSALAQWPSAQGAERNYEGFVGERGTIPRKGAPRAERKGRADDGREGGGCRSLTLRWAAFCFARSCSHGPS